MKPTIKICVVQFLVLCLSNSCFGQTRGTVDIDPSPILLELFTSEGCSSCPPADTFVQQLDTSQPVPGAQLIVLSEHVDYFNHEGWTDPYSSPLITERQNAYVHALGLDTAYTPQIIVDGTEVLHLDDPQQMKHVFQLATTTPTIHIHLDSVNNNAKDPNVLNTHIEIGRGSDQRNVGIYLAVALDQVTSHVLRGENGGQSLTHVAVLQSLTKIGKLKKGSEFNEDVHVKLKSRTGPQKIRIIVFLQENGPGRVLGAAMTKVVH